MLVQPQQQHRQGGLATNHQKSLYTRRKLLTSQEVEARLCGGGLLRNGHVVGVLEVAEVLDGDGGSDISGALGGGFDGGTVALCNRDGDRVGVLEVGQVLPLGASALHAGGSEGKAGEGDGDESGGLHDDFWVKS